ncbi:MAG: YezD family protein [Planctomycetaceae bacterium]
MTMPAQSQEPEKSLASDRQRLETLPDPVSRAILNALQGLRFGQVTLIVHDGRVMQIDRTDRFRLAGQDAVGH